MNYTREDVKRFWRKVDIRGPDECWLWLGCTSSAGYGTKRASFCLHGKSTNAARFAYWFTTSTWPGELYVCHSCDNKLCVNPNHLWLGNASINALDMYNKRSRNGIL